VRVVRGHPTFGKTADRVLGQSQTVGMNIEDTGRLEIDLVVAGWKGKAEMCSLYIGLPEPEAGRLFLIPHHLRGLEY
jgi:hypothetical protein